MAYTRMHSRIPTLGPARLTLSVEQLAKQGSTRLPVTPVSLEMFALNLLEESLELLFVSPPEVPSSEDESGRCEMPMVIVGLSERGDDVDGTHSLPRRQPAALGDACELCEHCALDLRRVLLAPLKVELARLEPTVDGFSIKGDDRDERRLRLAVHPDLVDHRAAVGVDGLEALRAHEAAAQRTEEAVPLAEDAQLVVGRPRAYVPRLRKRDEGERHMRSPFLIY